MLREWPAKKFNMDKCAERYLKLYRDLVGRPRV